jgi:uncharacterized protein with von Willebrand factor type A (vWA) domain
MLRSDVLDAQFAGMRAALQAQRDGPDDPAGNEAMQRVRDMVADLNQLLAAHARGEDTTDAFEQFLDKHGDFFPEQPRDTDDLIDLLARRQAAAERMLRSLRPEQRDELQRLMADALDDPDLESELGQLQDNLKALRPGARARGRRCRCAATSRWTTATRWARSPTFADLEALQRQLGQDHPGCHVGRRGCRRPRAPARSLGGRRPAGAARPGAGAGATGLPQPWQRWPAADARRRCDGWARRR